MSNRFSKRSSQVNLICSTPNFEGGGFEVSVARGGWKTKGESLCASFEYFMNTTFAISTGGRILSGYTNPRAPCFPPRLEVFVTNENRDKVAKMVANLFNQTFEISSSPYLGNFAKSLFACLVQHHEAMQQSHGMDHIIVRNVIASAQKFGVTMAELSDWGNLVRDDFVMRNASRHSSGNSTTDYQVHFNTVSVLHRIKYFASNYTLTCFMNISSVTAKRDLESKG